MKRISVKIDTIAYVLYFYTPVNISSKNILDFCTNIFELYVILIKVVLMSTFETSFKSDVKNQRFPFKRIG